MIFGGGPQAPPVRQYCLGCRFWFNVQRVEAGEDVELLGSGPCYGQCSLHGLTGLNANQRHRLEHACAEGHFTATEMEFVQWSGNLPIGGGHRLVKLHGDARDARLRGLMAEHTPRHLRHSSAPC